MDSLCSTKILEAEMKTFKIGLFVLTVFMIVPINLLAQSKEVPLTSSSKEALKLFLDGRAKFDDNEFVAAASLFDQAIQADPDFAMAYLYRSQSGGGYNIYRKNLDNAISHIGSTSEGEKLEIQYSQAYAEGNGQKEKELLDKLLALFPSDKRVQSLAGTYYFGINDFSNAIKHLSKATELDKNYSSAYNMIGYCQSALNNYPEAEKAFQTYIRLEPDRGNPYDSYGELLLKMGKYSESIEQYKKAFEKDPLNFASSLNGIGDNYIFKGDYETARKYYQENYDLVSGTSEKLTSMFLKAISYVHEGKVDNAIKTLDEYRLMAEKWNQVPPVIWSYFNQGFVYMESGKPAEGVKLFDNVTDIIGKSKLPETDKENMLTTSMMWHVYGLISNNELDKALPELEKNKQKVESRKNPVELMNLNSVFGFFEMKKGNYDKALEYFSKANNEDPWNLYYTAVVYDKKGDRQKAKGLYEKITKWNINGMHLALVRERAMEGLKK